MANSLPRQRLNSWIMTALLLLIPSISSYGDHETLGDLSELQQDLRWIKSTIEHLKLQRELASLRPTAGTTQKICQPSSGLGSLSLSTLYKANQEYYATFTYNKQIQVAARRGEKLLCGETVLNITLEGVELEKQGQRYQITGQVSTLLLPTTPPSLQARSGNTHAAE